MKDKINKDLEVNKKDNSQESTRKEKPATDILILDSRPDVLSIDDYLTGTGKSSVLDIDQ